MPKTQLFETELCICREYLVKTFGEDWEDIWIEKSELIKPGMVFTMNYTHTRFYKSEDANTTITIVSIRTIIEDDRIGFIICGCVLKTNEPIYICERSAFLGRNIYLYKDDILVASGGVTNFLEINI